jgi:hypothetical protein
MGKTSRNLVRDNFIGTSASGTINFGNKTGVLLYQCSDNSIVNNKIWYNNSGLEEKESKNYIVYNDVQYNTGNTGIHLNNSNSLITGNRILNDQTDGIHTENGSKPIIAGNSIHGNSNYGVRNSDPNVTINASGNWWGNADGPGSAITGNVTADTWLTEEKSFSIIAALDTLFIPEKKNDSLSVFILNRDNPEDKIDVLLTSDISKWITSGSNFTIDLAGPDAGLSNIFFSLPADAVDGNVSKVSLSATSRSNPLLNDTDTFYIAVYKSVLENIVIRPDTLTCMPGDTSRFYASGYDNRNQEMSVEVSWSAAGGVIDSDGWYIAGAEEGIFEIRSVHAATGKEDIAYAKIGSYSIKPDLTGTETENTLPGEFFLSQNYPNPFNPVTTIGYAIPKTSVVTIEIYNILGQRVAQLVNEEKLPGYYRVTFNSSHLSSGIYFYNLRTSYYCLTKKMIVIK